MEHHEPDNTAKENLIFNIIKRKINQLPEAERNLLEYESTYIGINAALSGLIASLFRSILNVTKGCIVSSIPMAVVPFIFTADVSYKGFIRLPLNTGDLNCEACTIICEGLVGFMLGGLYPVILAILVTSGLAARYSSAMLPEKTNILAYWIGISKPVFRKMLFPMLFQTMFTAYLGSKQYKLLIKALQLPEPSQEIQ